MISAYLADKILRRVLRNEAFTPAPTLYLALYSSEMAADGTGGVELSGGSYARMAIDSDTTDWAAPVGKEIANALLITIPVPSANWDEAVYAALIDAASGAGNVYFHDFLNDSFTNLNGARRHFDPAAIVMRMV